MRPRPQRGAGWLQQPRGSRWGRRTLVCVQSCRRECCSSVWSWQRLLRWREIPPWSPFHTPPLLRNPGSWCPAHLEGQNTAVIPIRTASPKSVSGLSDDSVKAHSTCLSSTSEAAFTWDACGLGRVAGVPESQIALKTLQERPLLNIADWLCEPLQWLLILP